MNQLQAMYRENQALERRHASDTARIHGLEERLAAVAEILARVRTPGDPTAEMLSAMRSGDYNRVLFLIPAFLGDWPAAQNESPAPPTEEEPGLN